MNIHHHDETTKVIHGDCIETMNQMEPESVDAIVTDPPYGLGFMGKKWDGLPPSLEWAEACYRVLKPGGHIAAFGGTRTWHRLAVAIEDAGFEMRDSLAWLYGSGFPKSMDVSKAIDKAAGAEREVIGRKGGRYAYRHNPETASHAPNGMFRWGDRHYAWMDLPPNARDFFTKAAAEKGNITAPATPEAQQWDGWGTALKPAFEPIVLARKPLAEKTVARNVLTHGTGAINVDACRIGRAEGGRWPANVLLDQHTAAWVDEQSGHQKDGVAVNRNRDPQADKQATIYGTYKNGDRPDITYGGGGGASRFFYSAKAPKSERPTYTRPVLRLRDNLTPAQADHVRARLQEAGISLD